MVRMRFDFLGIASYSYISVQNIQCCASGKQFFPLRGIERRIFLLELNVTSPLPTPRR